MTTRRAGKGTAASTQDDPTNALPYAIDATMSLSPEELGVLQDQYISEQDKGYISVQTKFNLAW